MTIRLFAVGLLSIATAHPGNVNAQGTTEAASAATDLTVASPFGATRAVENTELHAITGQADLTQLVNAQNKGVVSGNTITGTSQTGVIHFDSGSFQNLNGLSLLSANTGNNVSINSSLNVNVAISNK